MRDEDKTKGQLIRELQNRRSELDELKASCPGLAGNGVEHSAWDFQQLMELSPDAIMVVGSQGEIYLTNPAMARMLGAEKSADILDKNFFAFPAPEQLEGCRKWFKKVIGSSRQRKETETRFLRGNGEPFPVEIAAASLLWQGKPSVQIIARDATEHKRVEQELRQLNQELEQRAIDRGIAELDHAKERARSQTTLTNQTKLLQSIIDSMGEALIVANDKLEVMLWNRTAKQMIGMRIQTDSPQSVEESIRITSLYLPDKVTPYPVDELPLVRAIRGESVDDAEIFVPNPKVSGGGTWLLCNSRPLRDEQGALKGGIIVFRDNTERKRIEEAIKESEAKNRALIKALPDLLFRVNKEGVFLEYHNSANLALAVPPQEFLGKNFLEILPPDLAVLAAQNLQLALEHKTVQVFEYQLTTDQGTDDFEARISSINDSEALCMIRNITERKQAVEALKASEATLRSFYDGASMMMGVIELVGDDVLHISVNQATANFFGTTPEAMCNKLASELGATKELSQAWLQAYNESAQTGKPVRFEYILKHKKEDRILSSTVSFIEKTSGGRQRFSYVVEDITERKRIEEAVKESEERYRQLVNNAGDIIYKADASGRIILFNPTATRILGYTEEELLGRHYLDVVHPDYHLKGEKFYGRQFVKKIPETYQEFPALAKDGTIVWLGQKVQLVIDGDRVVGFEAIARDITERKREEEALKASEERFSKVFQASPMSMNIRRLDDGHFVDVNESYIRALGLSREQVIGRTPLDLGVWENPAEYETFMELVRREKTVRNFECRLIVKTGAVATCLLTAEIIEVDGQQCVLTITTNITERKRAEEALKASEKRFSRAFHSSPMAMNIRRLDDGRFVDVNETYLRGAGLSRQQVLGRTPVELGLWENPADYEQFMEMIKRGEAVRNLECRLRVKGGRIAVALVTAELIEVDEQQCVLVITNDITKRKRQEEAIKASEERFSKMFHASPVSMTIRRLDDGRYVDANTQYLRATGQSLEEVLGRTPIELGLWENPAEYDRFMEMVRRGQTVRDFECRLVMKTGKEAICLFTAEIIEVDRQQCVLVITTNITERKRAEAEREQLIAQLQEALAKVKTLSGFLPICASCKMIRDDKGYWNQIEEYIRDHSEAEFSHSICPDCSEKLYGEYLRNKEKDKLNKPSKP